MDRRTFLTTALAATVATTEIPRRLRGLDTTYQSVGRPTRASSATSILDAPSSECPLDTVVIVMMENRSFDHYLGWLGDDAEYLEAGRRRYGPNFGINARVAQTFPDGGGQLVSTRSAGSYEREKVETRGCAFRDPGHSWQVARIQRDKGFIAPGTKSDEFALTYYDNGDLPVYAALARRFTVFDAWHSSLLGPTFPNRQYLLSAQSEGLKTNPGLKKNPRSIANGIFHADTIVERLAGAGVSTGYYNTNVPLLALWGPERMAPYIRSLDRYFEEASTGQLPHVAFVEPQFGGGDLYRTDDHPRGDIGMGQRWVREIFRAFVESPQWERGAFIVAYDEGGGFFDHVPPPLFADSRASRRDQDNFGQGGFRVPALLASPFARPGFVDHRTYDHTAIMRFLEWRFLGAPPEGHKGKAKWSLTLRDRSARNMGATLHPASPDPQLGFDLSMPLAEVAPGCTPAQLASHPPDAEADPFDDPDLQDLAATRFPGATHRPWLADLEPGLR